MDVKNILERLGAEEAVRKMAAFQLQNNVFESTFAREFIDLDGLSKLKTLIDEATGNTLAYGLTAFAKLLQVADVQVEVFGVADKAFTDRIIDLVISHPLVNILRPATLILVILVSHRDPANPVAPQIPSLASVVAQQPNLAQVLVGRLTAADYSLCANSLMLLNAISRDAMKSDFKEWTRYVRIIYSYGANRNVSVLMYSTQLKDLTAPILDFQNLAKLLAKRWRDYEVDKKKKDCRKVLGLLQQAVSDSKEPNEKVEKNNSPTAEKELPPSPPPASNDEEPGFDWTKLGFQTNDPTNEINEMGFLGLLDFASFVQRDSEAYRKMVLEQLAKPPQLRCPIAKASVAITSLLYDQFSLSTTIDTPAPISPPVDSPVPDPDETFQPLYLQWLRIHSAAVKAFLRLWRDTGAESPDDLPKIIELTRVLLSKTVKHGTRDLEIYDVEQAIEECASNWRVLRREQLDAREGEHERAWGESLACLTERLQREAEEFIREQRISCLLQGDWFETLATTKKQAGTGEVVGERDGAATPTPFDPKTGMRGGRWRYVRLKGDRKTLCWGDFETKKEGRKVRLDELSEHADLSKVVNVAFSSYKQQTSEPVNGVDGSSHPPIYPLRAKPTGGIHTKADSKSDKERKPMSISLLPQSSQDPAAPILTLYPISKSVAVEWRDALRYLTGMTPGEETVSFTRRLAEVGVRVKLLDIVAGGVEIPTGKPLIEGVSTEDGVAGNVAITGEFWYDNTVD